MVRFSSHTWTSALQERLEREAIAQAMGTSVIPVGEEFSLEDVEDKSDRRLSFGPYGASPLSGLHFDAAEDAVAS